MYFNIFMHPISYIKFTQLSEKPVISNKSIYELVIVFHH
jgi:hypothetical protein